MTIDASWRACTKHQTLYRWGETCPACAPPGDTLAADLLGRIADRLAELHATNVALRERLAAREREIAHLRARVLALEWAHG